MAVEPAQHAPAPVHAPAPEDDPNVPTPNETVPVPHAVPQHPNPEKERELPGDAAVDVFMTPERYHPLPGPGY